MPRVPSQLRAVVRAIGAIGKLSQGDAPLRLGAFALVGAISGWGLTSLALQNQQSEKAAKWLQLADDLIPAEIEKLKAANQSLVLLIQQAKGRFGERELALYAPQLLRDLPPYTAFTLAPGGVLEALYPQPSTTAWRGVNLLEDPRYQRSSSDALQRHDTVLQGPAPLLKGGTGLIVRTPVYLGPQRRFWGFVSSLGPWSTWLRKLETKARNNDPPIRFALEINDSEGKAYRSDDYHNIARMGLNGMPVRVPGGTVTLAAAPLGFSANQTTLLVLASLSGASIGAGTMVALRERKRIQQLALLSLQLESAQAMERYQALFEESLDAILVINRNQRFIEANSMVLAMYGAESNEAFLQLSPLDLSPELQPDGRPSGEVVVERIHEAFETGGVEFEYLHRRVNTGELWLGQVSLRRITFHGEKVLMARVRDITERRHYEQRIETLAYRDGLTHLPNRAAIHDWLNRQLQANKSQIWLLINLDIDDFRSLNDAFGQDLGDQVICWLADALAAMLPPSACLARLDSDEFLAVLPIEARVSAEGAEAQAHQWAKALQQRACEAACQQSSSVPRISLSAGCAFTTMDGGRSALAALQQASTALQQAKEGGRGNVSLYSPAISALIQERLALENALELALAPEQRDRAFRLLYQPQVNRAGRLVRAEALLRWRGSDGREIVPDLFIPLAERSGQIFRLGRWVIEAAIRQQALWRDQGLALVPLSVNVSACQLADLPGTQPLLVQLQEHLKQYQLLPRDIVLELTETALLKDEHHTWMQLNQLTAAGFRLALDDFGTGYSSLTVLRDYPVAQVKIDKSFTRHVGLDPRSCSIVEALVGISRSRCMDLVAEGVETNAQREALTHLGARRTLPTDPRGSVELPSGVTTDAPSCNCQRGPEQLEDVVGGGHQAPFPIHLLQTA